MPRIRSIHHGQWKDEAFVSVSFPARLLAIGLRNMADDHGVFEWKPVLIRMELFPADSVSVVDLLDELLAVDIIQAFDASGRKYGVIRNFLRWQRPQRPSYLHPFPEMLASYIVGSVNDEAGDGGNSRNLHPASAPIPRKRNQRKEEGGRRESRREKSTSPSGDVSPSSEGDAPPAESGELPLGPPPATSPPRKAPLPLQASVDAWNEICGPVLGMVQTMTDQRRRHLGARLEEHFAPNHLEGWRGYCRRILESPFLTGRVQGNRPWRCDFDFAVSASGAAKILEGKYHDQDRRPPPGDRPLPPGTV